jgi:hypothetical protein
MKVVPKGFSSIISNKKNKKINKNKIPLAVSLAFLTC